MTHLTHVQREPIALLTGRLARLYRRHRDLLSTIEQLEREREHLERRILSEAGQLPLFPEHS